MAIHDQLAIKDTFHPNVNVFIDHLIKNSCTTELDTFNFAKDEYSIDSGLTFKVIPKSTSGVHSLLAQHLNNQCDRFSLIIPYAGACFINCHIIMNAQNLDEFDFCVPEFPEFEEYLSSISDDLPSNAWDATDPSSLEKVIRGIRKLFKRFELMKSRERLIATTSSNGEGSSLKSFNDFIANLEATETMRLCECFRQDRSESFLISNKSKKKHQLQFGGEMALKLPENLKSMETGECSMVVRFALDISNLKVTNVKFEPEVGLVKLMERKDKYFSEEEDVLGIPSFTEDLNILEYLSEIQQITQNFINRIVEKYEARKSLMWSILPDEFGFKSLKYIDMIDFCGCVLFIKIEDEAVTNPTDRKAHVFIEIVCDSEFPQKYPAITISARKDNGQGKSLKPTTVNDLGNLDSLPDVLPALRSLIVAVVKTVLKPIHNEQINST